MTTPATDLAVAAAAGVMPLPVAGQLVPIGTLFAIALVCAGVQILRGTLPDPERPFKIPVVWATTPLGILLAVLLLAGLPPDTCCARSSGWGSGC